MTLPTRDVMAMDVLDGPEEPLVYHNNTLTSKIYFRDCIETIKEFAFVYSQPALCLFNTEHRLRYAHARRKMAQDGRWKNCPASNRKKRSEA
uniref:phosphoinositide phospholipase C n=1 Tax=Timema bartmani TaxID=61472 RepID=A0A7R9ETQ3_9NEOP|nr:unnamed protein product [Timema bartmani]